MRKAGRLSIACAMCTLYISFSIAAGGNPACAFFRRGEPARGNARSPNSRGRLSLNSQTRPPTKLKEKRTGVLPVPKKRKRKKKKKEKKKVIG